MKWGRLINTALDCGLDGEDALWAVLCAAHRLRDETPLLTGSETRALDALTTHGSYKAAAADLGLAQSTVYRYAKESARKLGVSVREAPAEAEQRGLLDRMAA